MRRRKGKTEIPPYRATTLDDVGMLGSPNLLLQREF